MLSLCPRAILAAKLLAAESQLAVCKHRIRQKKDPRPRFTAGFRLLWVVLSKSLDKWEDIVHLMQPATVKKWHTTAFRYFWRWKSRRKGGAIDFFTVTTINFYTLYVFLVFDHGRRKVIHFAITRNPFMNWVIQQLREAMPFGLQLWRR